MRNQQLMAAAAQARQPEPAQSSSARKPAVHRRDAKKKKRIDSSSDDSGGEEESSASLWHSNGGRPRTHTQVLKDIKPGGILRSQDAAKWFLQGSPLEKERAVLQRTVLLLTGAASSRLDLELQKAKAQTTGSFGEFAEDAEAIEKITLGPVVDAHRQSAVITFHDAQALDTMLGMLGPGKTSDGEHCWNLPRPRNNGGAQEYWLLIRCNKIRHATNKFLIAQHLDRLGLGHYDKRYRPMSTEKGTVGQWSLDIKIIKGRDFPALDIRGTSDPFCKIYYQKRKWYELNKNADESSTADWRTPLHHRDAPTFGCCGRPQSFGNEHANLTHERHMKLEQAGQLQRTVAADDEQGLQYLGTTPTKYNTLDPNFAASMDYIPSGEEHGLKRGWLMIDIWDHDFATEPDAMGRVIVDLSDLEYDTVYNRWYPLVFHPKQLPGYPPVGELRLQLAVKSPAQLSERLAWMLNSYDFVEIQRTLLHRHLWPFERCQLQLHLDDIVQQAFSIFDVDSDGTIRSMELKHVMQVLGESLTDDEMAEFIAEAWLYGGHADQDDAESGSAMRITADDLPPEIDLESDVVYITYDTFRFMLTDYWTNSKFSIGVGKGYNAPMFTPNPPTPFTVEVDVKAVRKSTKGINNCSCKEYALQAADEPVALPTPTWMAEIAQNHSVLSDHHRVPQMFWYFLRRKLEQVLILRCKVFGKVGAGASDSSILFRPRGEADIFTGGLWVQNPESTFSTVWDVAQVFFLAYVSISVPLQAGFDITIDNFSAMWFIELTVDVYFVVDVLLNFRKPYVNEHGVMRYNSVGMAVNYAKGWLLPDLASCVSLLQYVFLISDNEGASDAASKAKMTKTLRLIRLTKLLRLARLQRVFNRLPDDVMAVLAPIGNIFVLLVTTCFAMHLVSCFWHLAGIADEKAGWVEEVWPGNKDDFQNLRGTDTAPINVTMSQFSCHPTANQVFFREAALINHRPHYQTLDKKWQLYWSQNWESGTWILDSDTDETENAAYIVSQERSPTTQGDQGDQWKEFCGGWASTSVSVIAGPLELIQDKLIAVKVKVPELMERYLKSLYIVMLGDFPGDPTPIEMGFALVSVIVNSFIYGSVAATLSSIMMMMKAPYTEYNNRMRELKNWMRSKGLKWHIRDQIEIYYDKKLSTSDNIVVDELAILNELSPSPIAAELVQILYANTIERVPIFQRLNQEVIVQLCLLLQPIPAMPGAPVVKQGDMANEMYIVTSGRLQAWERNSSAPVRAQCVLRSGKPFWATVISKMVSTADDPYVAAATIDLSVRVDDPRIQHSALVDATALVKGTVRLPIGYTNSGGEDGQGSSGSPKGGTFMTGGWIAALTSGVSISTSSRKTAERKGIHQDDGEATHLFFTDFDPALGPANVKGVKQGSIVQVMQVRQGNVLGYLEGGDYFGEGCLEDERYRHARSVTAMTEADMCYLCKDDVAHVASQYPHLRKQLRKFARMREQSEAPRKLFNHFDVNQDGSLGRKELVKLLQALKEVPDETIDKEIQQMDWQGDESISFEEFSAWWLRHEISNKGRARRRWRAAGLAVLSSFANMAREKKDRGDHDSGGLTRQFSMYDNMGASKGAVHSSDSSSDDGDDTDDNGGNTGGPTRSTTRRKPFRSRSRTVGAGSGGSGQKLQTSTKLAERMNGVESQVHELTTQVARVEATVGQLEQSMQQKMDAILSSLAQRTSAGSAAATPTARTAPMQVVEGATPVPAMPPSTPAGVLRVLRRDQPASGAAEPAGNADSGEDDASGGGGGVSGGGGGTQAAAARSARMRALAVSRFEEML